MQSEFGTVKLLFTRCAWTYIRERINELLLSLGEHFHDCQGQVEKDPSAELMPCQGLEEKRRPSALPLDRPGRMPATYRSCAVPRPTRYIPYHMMNRYALLYSVSREREWLKCESGTILTVLLDIRLCHVCIPSPPLPHLVHIHP